MSDSARRKERQRLKREKKKAQMRRAMSVSPYKRVGEFGELQACYINANWRESGMATIHVVRQNPSGGYALACFLVDIWCAGLKDTFGWLDMGSDETEDHLDRASEGLELIRIELSMAQRLVAGSIRFARQNGFRLPAHFDRWVRILGELPEARSADLADFGKDGKLVWIGPIDDLQGRLIGSTIDEFLARSDVEFVTEGEDTDEVDPAFQRELLDEMIERLTEQAHDWCREHQVEASPLLRDALLIRLALELMQEEAGEAADESEDSINSNLDLSSIGLDSQTVKEAATETIQRLKLLQDGIPPELERAIQQASTALDDFAEAAEADPEFQTLMQLLKK